jgi:hypothetical protein
MLYRVKREWSDIQFIPHGSDKKTQIPRTSLLLEVWTDANFHLFLCGGKLYKIHDHFVERAVGYDS